MIFWCSSQSGVYCVQSTCSCSAIRVPFGCLAGNRNRDFFRKGKSDNTTSQIKICICDSLTVGLSKGNLENCGEQIRFDQLLFTVYQKVLSQQSCLEKPPLLQTPRRQVVITVGKLKTSSLPTRIGEQYTVAKLYKLNDKQRHFADLGYPYTVKKGSRFSRPQPGCHLLNPPWPGIIQLFPSWESLLSDIPAGDGKTRNLFYSVYAEC